MAIGPVVTRGYGSLGDIPNVVKRGYTIGPEFKIIPPTLLWWVWDIYIPRLRTHKP